MKAEYCVVGPAFVLEGEGDRAGGRLLVLNARGREGGTVARLTGELRDDIVRIEPPRAARPLDPSEVTELIRLFARVCTDFWMYRFALEIASTHDLPTEVQAALLADGFVAQGQSLWARDPAPFPARHEKAATMEEVYQDLFTVPWNFVPRESDVFTPLLTERSRPGLAVLDLGCGLGKNVGPLESAGLSVYGIDPAHAAIRRCRDLVAHPSRFIVASAANLPWKDGSFQRVLDVGSLHCMPAPERGAAAGEIARVLSRGGILYSRFFKPRGAAWIRMQPMQVDQFGLTTDEITSLLEGALTCESVREEGMAIYVKAVKR